MLSQYDLSDMLNLKGESKRIASQMIDDYGQLLSQDSLTKLETFGDGEHIIFIDKSSFPESDKNAKTPGMCAKRSEGNVYFV